MKNSINALFFYIQAKYRASRNPMIETSCKICYIFEGFVEDVCRSHLNITINHSK